MGGGEEEGRRREGKAEEGTLGGRREGERRGERERREERGKGDRK